MVVAQSAVKVKGGFYGDTDRGKGVITPRLEARLVGSPQAGRETERSKAGHELTMWAGKGHVQQRRVEYWVQKGAPECRLPHSV